MKISSPLYIALMMGLFAVPNSAEAQRAQIRCAGELGAKSSAFDLILCIQNLALALEASQSANARLENLFAELQDVPNGAVVAFDRGNGCPKGWSNYAVGAGRAIVGAGSGNFGTNNKALTSRDFGETGGEETVTLTVDEMPRHSHEIGDPDGNPLRYQKYEFGGTGGGAQLLHSAGNDIVDDFYYAEESGNSQPHNNMPPFIALYFCKKD